MQRQAAGAPHPLRRQTVPEEIAGHLAHDILEGVLSPGQRLVETELVTRFEASRGTIREAMALLARDGLVRHDVHRGHRVTMLERADVDDIMGMRRLIEPEAVRQLATRRVISPPLRAAAAAMIDARVSSDWRRYGALDVDFHATLVSAAGSARLADIVRDHLVLLTLALLHSDRIESATAASMSHVDEHTVLLDLVERGACEDAVQLMHRHLDAAAERLAAAVGDHR